MTTSVLVFDGHLQSALAVVRSLGSRGIPVYCGSTRRTAMSRYSLFCKKAFSYTSSDQDRVRFLDDVDRVLSQCKEPPILFPMSDFTFLPLVRSWERFQGRALLPFSSRESIEEAFDKEYTLKLALREGVPIPATHFSLDELSLDEALHSMRGPFVIKPRNSCTWVEGKSVWGTAHVVESIEEARRVCLKIFHETNVFPLLQEWIPGEEYGVFALYEHGVRKASFAHHRLRSLNPRGGASSLRESIPLPEDMAAYAWKLLDALAWHGPAMVEFRRDARDGAPKLMEINGRFWGSFPLAVHAGVDFPYLVYQMETGRQSLLEQAPYKTFIKSRHLLADGQHVLRVLFGKRASLHKRLTTLWQFFHFWEKNLYYDVESLRDPLPGIMEVIDVVMRKIL
jgi:predicted ATP-grasp superfamily ATP-dependent carboligase